MSIVIRGRDPHSSLIRRPGGSLRMLDDGSWEGREKFTCAYLSVPRFAPVRNSTAHPDFSSLLCVTCDSEKDKAGMATLDVTYRGLFGSPTAVEELTVSTSEQPIETHDRYKDISEADQDKLKAYFEGGGSKPTFTDSKATELMQKRLKGIQSYVAPSTIYKVTTLQAARPASIADVGTIVEPPNPPSLPHSGMNWLKNSKTWKRIGGVWIIDENYQLSGRQGWDAELYAGS